MRKSPEHKDIKIVINALQYKNNSSGIGILLRELFGRFAQTSGSDRRVILPKGSPEFPGGDAAQKITAPFVYEQGLKRIAFQSFLMGPRYCSDAILLITDTKLPFFLPASTSVVSVITDLAVFRMPEVYSKSRAFLWKFQYHYLLRRCCLFLAISEFTKKELMELLRVPPEMIRVLPCAAPSEMERVDNTAALRKKYGLPERFILFVGNFNPRKNLERLIAAFDRVKRETGIPQALVIAGGQGWKFDPEEALRGIEAKNEVYFTGYIADEDMPALYSAAELFAFPTLYEGFGIPVLEAQKCGTPVLTSDTSALPEVGGDGAYYVDPMRVDAIAEGIRLLLTDADLREELIRKGYENAKRFSWEKSARQLDEMIKGYFGT